MLADRTHADRVTLSGQVGLNLRVTHDPPRRVECGLECGRVLGWQLAQDDSYGAWHALTTGWLETVCK